MRYLVLLLLITGCVPDNVAKQVNTISRGRVYEVWFKDYAGNELHLKCNAIAVACGVQLSNCDDGYDYDCMHNVKDHETSELK